MNHGAVCKHGTSIYEFNKITVRLTINNIWCFWNWQKRKYATHHPVSGSGKSRVCMALAPGYIWTRKGSPALTSAHLELTHSEAQRRCINNAFTCTVCSSQEIHRHSPACMHFPKNKYTACPHTYELCICPLKLRHMQERSMLGHVIAYPCTNWTLDADGPSLPHELWACVCILCTRGHSCFTAPS